MQGSVCQSEQGALQCDLDKLMKDMRASEDNFLCIVQHILKILQSNEADSCIFVNEDVCQYRALTARLRTTNTAYQQDYSSLLHRYYQPSPQPEGSDTLIKRVTYRLFEIIFNSVSAVSSKMPHLFQEYLRLKISCQKAIQEGSSNRYQLFKLVTDYEFGKVSKYLQLLNELTNHLENGDLELFSKAELSCFIESRTGSKESHGQTKTSFFNSLKVNKIRVKEKQASKPEIITSQKKTIFPRKARMLFDSLKDIMEIGRQQFLEDYTCHTDNTKEHLYRELWARNKVNHQAITDFQQKKRRIQNKLKAKMPGRDQKTQRTEAKQQERVSMEFKPTTTTRKSLLLKLKGSDRNTKALPSQLFRKTSKFQDVRLRVKSYNRERAQEKGKEEEQMKENEEEGLAEDGQSEVLEERLPILNKRAQSVDQNYKLPESSEASQVRTLSNSLKINEQVRVRGREKVQMHPVKVKLQLKAVGLLGLEGSRKVKLGELSKYLYF